MPCRLEDIQKGKVVKLLLKNRMQREPTKEDTPVFDVGARVFRGKEDLFSLRPVLVVVVWITFMRKKA